VTHTPVVTDEGTSTTAVGTTQRGIGVAVLFAATSFLGASLLFMIQPLAAKLVLPSYGGSATVWSTSSLLFQMLLLAGYVYAHVSTRRLGARWQPRAHLLLLSLPLLMLPVALPPESAPSADVSPVLWLLRTLLLMVGLPFAVLSTTGPLIQRWYAWSDGPRANDPYFLFASGNLGSFIGLLAYPFAVEPLLTLTQQRMCWSVAFGGFVLLMALCGLVVRGGSRATDTDLAAVTAGPSRHQVALWCFWSFLPSSLMLAVTAHLSTDIAAIPLLWVLPLAGYLASFVLAFARTSRTVPPLLVMPCVIFATSTGLVSELGSNVLGPFVGVVVIANVVAVTCAGFAAHARLAATRPDPAHLTLFYLVISAGGALGGVLNGVVAPLLFDGVWEYLFTVALLPALAVGLPTPRISRRHMRVAASTVSVALLALVVLRVMGVLGLVAAMVAMGAVAVGSVVAWLTLRVPILLTVALLLASVFTIIVQEQSSLLTERTFYGSYRVRVSDEQHELVHGTTIHGTQFLDAGRKSLPTTYYAPEGPFGDLIRAVSPDDLAVVGLGAGAIAAYGADVSRIKFFEIDPVVAGIAEDRRWFSYLSDSAAEVDVVMGDGRLAMAREPAASFDLVALDAFSSDSIPVHVLTREGIEVFYNRLRPGGALAVHISNRIFDLQPVLAAHARDLGLRALIGRGGEGPGAVTSEWVMLTDSDTIADRLGADPRWAPLPTSKTTEWTDDYSSVLSVMR
jgi:spermidine synthase